MNTHLSEHAATTTEELIVQYLDGELVRKELEAVLFERLAHAPEARMLLREHLVIRGAIRSTLDHGMFQLSSDLDAKTRGRIEEMLKQGLPVPGVIALEADAPAIATSPATRSLKRWALRPALATLVLLLAVGSTWYVTRTATIDKLEAGKSVAMNQPKSSEQMAPQLSTSDPATPSDNQAGITPSAVPSKANHPVREIIRYVKVPVEVPQTANTEMAQNAETPVVSHPAAAEVADPADIMISHRYAKMLNTTAKREVVVSDKDRL